MIRVLRLGWAAVLAMVALTGPDARAVDQDAVNKAIHRGVAFLHDAPTQNQIANPGGNQPLGAEALVGLTLLECGAAPDDKVVQRALADVRAAGVTMHETYTLALSILFLDRFGDPTDVPLIESMTVRLLAGQTSTGGWTYNCPDIGESEVRRLTSHLKQQAELIGRRVAPREPDKDGDGTAVKRGFQDLPKEIQEQLALINRVPVAGPAFEVGGDNSNTQFATLALWVAHRHGLPVEKALLRIDQRHRATQNADGGWSYMPAMGVVMGGSTATMTCAGLLGLAAAHGIISENALEKGKAAPDPAKDRVLRVGLGVLGTAVGVPVGRRPGGDLAGVIPAAGGKTYYFFWSLERVCVILDLDTIGGKDWYGWGSEILLANQAANGSWQGEYPAAVDTCFALLFLKRANLAKDLTASLKGKLQDPGEITLKSGGVGGDALARVRGLKPGLESKGPAENRVVPRPPAEDTEGARLARELVQAPAERRDPLLEKYRDAQGVTFTEALAGAIPQMSGEGKSKARDALAERLTRMKVETLGRYFQDQDAEIRRAAALASAMKEARTLVPDLIPLLGDAEPAVARAAYAALKDLTGADPGSTAEEWKTWWSKQDRK